MPRPPDEVLTEILNFAYEQVSKINFQEYERFVNDIVFKLKVYKENQQQMTASSTTAIPVRKRLEKPPIQAVIMVPDRSISKNRTSIKEVKTIQDNPDILSSLIQTTKGRTQ